MVMGGVDKQFHQKFEAKRSGNENGHNVTSAEPVQLEIKFQIDNQPACPKTLC